MIALLAAAHVVTAAVRIAELHAPYVRVQLPGAFNAGVARHVASLRVVDDRGREVPYVLDPYASPWLKQRPVATASRPDPASDPGTQRFTVDLGEGYEDATIAGARVITTTPAFARFVQVDASDDGASWTVAGRGRIERFPGDGDTHVVYAGGSGRFRRVTIENESDAPLANARVELLADAHEIVFPAQRARRYTVRFGDDALDAPSYDLADVLRHDRRPVQRATLGPVVRAGASPPRAGGALAPPPAAPSRAWIAPAAFGLAIVALGVAAVRLLRGR